MILTTIMIDEELYRRLIDKSIEKYGKLNKRNVGKTLNEILEKEFKNNERKR